MYWATCPFKRLDAGAPGIMIFLTTGRLVTPHNPGKPSFFELCTEIGQLRNGVVILDIIFK
jgi:hypothetical protein